MVLTSFFQSPWRALDTVFDALPEQHRATAIAAAGALVVVLPFAAWLFASTRRDSSKGAVRLPIVLPTTLPVLGNLLDIIRNKQVRHDWFTQLGEQYQGHPFQLTMIGRSPVTIIYSPELVEDALKTHFEHVPKGPVQREAFRDVLGHGIFAADGATWVHQRKTASQLFTARALRETMTESMRRYTTVLLRILEKAHDNSETIEVFKLMSRFTIEAFAKMGFGIEMGCLESEQEHPFQAAFDSSQRIMMSRFQRPLWFWKLQRFLSLGGEGQLKRDVAVIDKTMLDIVAKSLAKRDELGSKGLKAASADIVGLFLDRFDGSNGEKLDVTYLRDVVVNFLIAGRDTTAQAMSWCFHSLNQHPEVVVKIRAEIQQILPDFASGKRKDPPTMEEVQQLVYLDAVLKETLRLYPSVPLIPKEMAQDLVFSDGTLIRAGSVLGISTYAMGRMEFVWGPDAKQFKPERFIDPDTGKLINISAFKFASFNAGPRMCLGMNLAMLEMKIVLTSVLSRFNIELLPNQEITYDNSLTLPIKGAMLARITKA